MPSSREEREKRRLGIVKILRDGEPVGQQQDIVEKLREMGIPATQSSVSRDLTELGAVRLHGRWILAGLDKSGAFGNVVAYMKEVRPAGPHLTLLATEPGAGALVAQAIEESNWDEIEGTVAGLNSVLILTRDALSQKLLLQRLQVYLRDSGVEDEGTSGARKPSESTSSQSRSTDTVSVGAALVAALRKVHESRS